ncbi:hypothetical protein JCM8202_000817 [Rhodotorula sphaerocarpa]
MSEKIVQPLRQLGSRSLAVKSHLVAATGEFVGTVAFLWFALAGTHVANLPANSITGQTAAGLNGSTTATVNTSSLLYIAFAFGMSLTVTAWCMSRVSGGLYNPNVTFGLLLAGAMSPLRAGVLTVVQYAAGIAAAGLVSCMFPGSLNVRTTLSPGTSIVRGLFIETFCTFLLMLAIIMCAAEKNVGSFIAPLPIGLALFVAELASVSWTGGALNSARTLGPDVIATTFNGYTWIYFVGPYLGAALAAGFYRLIKYLEFVTAPEPIGSLDPNKLAAGTAGGAEANGDGRKPKKVVKVEAAGFSSGLISGPASEQPAASGLNSLDAREIKERLVHIEEMLAAARPTKQALSPGLSENPPASEFFDHLSYQRV